MQRSRVPRSRQRTAGHAGSLRIYVVCCVFHVTCCLYVVCCCVVVCRARCVCACVQAVCAWVGELVVVMRTWVGGWVGYVACALSRVCRVVRFACVFKMSRKNTPMTYTAKKNIPQHTGKTNTDHSIPKKQRKIPLKYGLRKTAPKNQTTQHTANDHNSPQKNTSNTQHIPKHTEKRRLCKHTREVLSTTTTPPTHPQRDQALFTC